MSPSPPGGIPHIRGLLVGSALMIACGTEPAARPVVRAAAPEATTPVDDDEAGREPIRLWVAGDVMSSAQIRDAAADATSHAEGIAAMLAPLSALWSGPRDFVVVNLETPVTRSRRRAHSAGPVGPRLSAVYLNSPPYLLEGLRLAGVDGVAVANNHALDQGPEGLMETLELARAAQLAVIGGGTSAGTSAGPLVLGEGAQQVALWNFYDAPTERPSAGGELSVLNEEAFEHIAATTSPHVVVLVHVVGELVEEPKDSWREWVQRIAEAGADVVLVHGTHVPMAVERVAHGAHETVVAWGLGNLLTDMGRMAAPRRQAESKITSPLTREGLVARITAGDELTLELLPTFETDDRFVRWHGTMPEAESSFWVRPLNACTPGVALPDDWPEPWRSEYAEWVSTRRDHLVAVTGLSQAPCGEVGWLRP